ncbi:hypothetical protein HON36_03830 [Candidatus Parcubacteria bacterium]|nr:hypothetical protein [Candidatus Parcubacteria bacterium]MBT7228996.1 hypothetical protein [Candidatus Parcubacteria bacterium]
MTKAIMCKKFKKSLDDLIHTAGIYSSALNKIVEIGILDEEGIATQAKTLIFKMNKLKERVRHAQEDWIRKVYVGQGRDYKINYVKSELIGEEGIEIKIGDILVASDGRDFKLRVLGFGVGSRNVVTEIISGKSNDTHYTIMESEIRNHDFKKLEI